MQITISDKLIKKVAMAHIEDCLGTWSPSTLSFAGIPSLSQCADQMLDDPKFIKGIEKYITWYITESSDIIADAMAETVSKVLCTFERAASAAEGKKRIGYELDRALEIVKNHGYTVSPTA